MSVSTNLTWILEVNKEQIGGRGKSNNGLGLLHCFGAFKIFAIYIFCALVWAIAWLELFWIIFFLQNINLDICLKNSAYISRTIISSSAAVNFFIIVDLKQTEKMQRSNIKKWWDVGHSLC